MLDTFAGLATLDPFFDAWQLEASALYLVEADGPPGRYAKSFE